jgi:hypothetical protein
MRFGHPTARFLSGARMPYPVWLDARALSPLSCPVSLDTRHGERHYQQCFKYVRRSARSIVSLTLRQVRKTFLPSYQLSGASASSR